MRNGIVAGALALAVLGSAACKEQANPSDAAKNNPQLGTPGAQGGPPGAVTGGNNGGNNTMQRQTAAGTPGGPTDDLGARPDAGAADAGSKDAGAAR